MRVAVQPAPPTTRRPTAGSANEKEPRRKACSSGSVASSSRARSSAAQPLPTSAAVRKHVPRKQLRIVASLPLCVHAEGKRGRHLFVARCPHALQERIPAATLFRERLRWRKRR